MRGTVYRYLRYGGCAALGIVFFLGAEAADTDVALRAKRN